MATTFSIARRTSVNASPERVLSFIENFREWVQWSPWEGLDPDLQRTYTGPERGAGSSYTWSGNRKAGAGTMDMAKSGADGVDIDLTFTKPFPARNHVRIDVTPTAAGTDVVWTMTGPQSAFNKLIFRLLKMEARLAADFDKGLAQLKAVAEAA